MCNVTNCKYIRKIDNANSSAAFNKYCRSVGSSAQIYRDKLDSILNYCILVINPHPLLNFGLW